MSALAVNKNGKSLHNILKKFSHYCVKYYLFFTFIHV
jgi:hypothetical protein